MVSRVLVIGASHTNVVARALAARPDEAITVINLHDDHRRLRAEVKSGRIARDHPADVVFSMLGGNYFNRFGLSEHPYPFDLVEDGGDGIDPGRALIHRSMLREVFREKLRSFRRLLSALVAQYDGPVYHLCSPPPTQSSLHLEAFPASFAAEIARGVAPARLRMNLYRLQTDILREYAEELGVVFISPPAEALDGEGFLAPDYRADDPTHGNARYGALVLAQIESLRERGPKCSPVVPGPTNIAEARVNPYRGLPDHQFWRKEPGIDDPATFDPVTRTSFRIAQDDAVVTAGSCFAQHVARSLAEAGFNFLVTETPHPIIPEETGRAYNFGLFSARYGNVYTARQLKQLIQRAYGEFTPVEQSWSDASGRVFDPFRPQIHPGGFVNAAELAADREEHFRAVREAFEAMSVFVFTLGLTEAWFDRRDGAVYPVAPGVATGAFDDTIHGFHNFTAAEVAADLHWCFARLREINPAVRFIVTVSPVPLNATWVDRHVFVSTTYSKSVLRVAAEEVCAAFDLCDYFPSYEIVTSPYSRGAYYAEDCREVTQAGVARVMACFLKHYGGAITGEAGRPSALETRRRESERHLKTMDRAVQLLCDEDGITNA